MVNIKSLVKSPKTSSGTNIVVEGSTLQKTGQCIRRYARNNDAGEVISVLKFPMFSFGEKLGFCAVSIWEANLTVLML